VQDAAPHAAPAGRRMRHHAAPPSSSAAKPPINNDQGGPFPRPREDGVGERATPVRPAAVGAPVVTVDEAVATDGGGTGATEPGTVVVVTSVAGRFEGAEATRLVAGVIVRPLGGAVVSAPLVGGGALGGVVGGVVGGATGGQIADSSGAVRGGGSAAVPVPGSWKRQPSRSPGATCHPAGPPVAYDQPFPVPCQYDQYA